MHICMWWVRSDVCMCECMHVCMHECWCVHAYGRIDVCIYVNTCIYIYIYVQIDVCMYVCSYDCIYSCSNVFSSDTNIYAWLCAWWFMSFCVFVLCTHICVSTRSFSTMHPAMPHGKIALKLTHGCTTVGKSCLILCIYICAPNWLGHYMLYLATKKRAVQGTSVVFILSVWRSGYMYIYVFFLFFCPVQKWIKACHIYKCVARSSTYTCITNTCHVPHWTYLWIHSCGSIALLSMVKVNYTYIYMHFNTCIETCVRTHIHSYMHKLIHKFLHNCTHTYILAYVKSCVHACKLAYMHAYIHTYTPLNIKTNTKSLVCKSDEHTPQKTGQTGVLIHKCIQSNRTTQSYTIPSCHVCTYGRICLHSSTQIH